MNLQDFVQAGGTLVCINDSCSLPIKQFNVPVRNVLEGKKSEEFYCPGSLLRVSIDPTHPLGYGMPGWFSGYFAHSQAFALGTSPDAEKEKNNASEEASRAPDKRFPATVVARYSDTVLLESGWIRGGDLIADKPAIVEVRYGEGRVVLLGFGVQRRAQTHGTFRILFNAIQESTLAPQPAPGPEQ